MDGETQFEGRLPTEDEIERIAEERKWLFGAVRLAPVEIPKFTFMAIISWSIIYIYSLLRAFKDAFTLDRQDVSCIYYMKTFLIPIVVIIANLILQKLYTKYTNKTILKNIFLFFGVYFLIYGFLILPFRDYIEAGTYFYLDIYSDGQMSYKSLEYLSAPCGIFFRWTSSLHFIMSEVWGAIVLSVLYMSFANDICPIRQFTRFIPLLLIIGNTGLFASALTVFSYFKLKGIVSYNVGNYIISLFFSIFAGISVLCYYLMSYLEKNILSRPLYIVQDTTKKTKKKVGFVDGLKTAFTSKVAIGMCTLVAAYNIMTNLTEVNNKSCIKKSAKINNSDIEAHVLSRQVVEQSAVSLSVIILLISPFQRLIQYSGWFTMAIIPPIYAVVFSSILMILASGNASEEYTGVIPSLGAIFKKLMPFLSIRVEEWLGLLIVAGYKIMKYGPFDLSKETIGRRIDNEYRPRFKGIYDGIFGKIGKSVGSLITIILGSVFDCSKDLREVALIYWAIMLVLSVGWFISVFYLSRKYDESVKNNTAIDIDLIDKKEKIGAMK